MKKTYTKPENKIINVIVEGNMLAASITVDAGQNTSENWSNEREDWSSEIWSDEEGM